MRSANLLLLCLWCIGFAECESADDDHLGLLQRSAGVHKETAHDDDIVDDDLDELDDDIADDDLDELGDDSDDLDDLEDEESGGLSVCASENQMCQCSGTVYYGRRYINGRPGSGTTTSLEQMRTSGFKSRSVSGSVSCSNGGMGGDPLSGFYKHCICDSGSSNDGTSSSASVCAQGEGANCQCDGTVYYGAKHVNGRPGGGQTTSLDQLKSRGYKSRSVSGSISCSSGAMGGDPLYGFYKYCYCEPRETPSPTPSPTAAPTPSPTSSPTGKCHRSCNKKYTKYVKKGKADVGVKRACKKSKCAGCSICR